MDGNPGYRGVAASLGIEAGRFLASYDGSGGDGVWHVQNVDAYDIRLKGTLKNFEVPARDREVPPFSTAQAVVV